MPRTVFVGVDIGGTKTAVCLSTSPPQIRQRAEFPTLPAEGPAQAVNEIIRTIRSLLSRQKVGDTEIAAIGVSCGGPLDSASGVILGPPNLKTWKQVRIKEILETQFHTSCYLENDANAGALAEHAFGAGRGTSNFVFLTMGTGLGAGLILNGSLYRGSTNSAGEIGHVRLSHTGPIGYDKEGSVEGWASGGGMALVAKDAILKAASTGVFSVLTATLQETGGLTARQIWKAAQEGDQLAAEVIRTCGTRLGEAIAILMDILNPERVVVGGLALRMGDTILQPAREAVQREALPFTRQNCDIVAAELGETIGDVAALCVAMHGSRVAEQERTL